MMPPPVPDHVLDVALALALGEIAGPMLVVGDVPLAVVRGAGAAASGLTLVGDDVVTAYLENGVRAFTPAWIDRRPAGVGGLDGLETHAHAVVWDLPDADPVAFLEALLGRIADGGRILVCIPRRRGLDHRVRALLESHCGGTSVDLTGVPRERLGLRAERRSSRILDDAVESPGVLPVSVVADVRGATPETEAHLCDLLVRQWMPPAEVCVVDRPGDHAPVDEHLFGLADATTTPVVLLRAEEDAPTVWNGVIARNESPFIAFTRAHQRLAPNALAILGMALESRPSWAAAVGWHARPHACDAGIVLPEGALRELLERGAPPPGVALMRHASLVRGGGFPVTDAATAWMEGWVRLAEKMPIGSVPVPLSRSGIGATERAGMDSAGRRCTLLESIGLARLAADFVEVDRDRREAAARELWERFSRAE